MPDPSPEQPPSWPPASESTAKPTNPPRITARGVGHLPSAAPEDEPDPYRSQPGNPADYGDLAPADPGPRHADPYGFDGNVGGFDGFAPPNADPEVPRQAEPPQSQWDEAEPGGEWPPKENRDWMNQQSQTGWGLSSGSAAWSNPGGVEPHPEPQPEPRGFSQPSNDLSYQPDPNAAPYGQDPRSAPPYPSQLQAPQEMPPPAPQSAGFRDLEFPELRPDPYEADLYGDAPRQGEAAPDPYQADRRQAEQYAAEQQYQGEPYQQQDQYQAGQYQQPDQYQGDQYGAGPQQGSYAEQAFSDQAYGNDQYGTPQSYGEQPYGDQAYRAEGLGTDTMPPEAVPDQRRSEEVAAPEAAPASPSDPPVRVAPPTHRGVRYAIYGIGGLITLGLIIGIVLLLGAPPPNEPSGQDDGDTTDQSAGGEELTPERYTELAGAVGTAAWFEWRYGTAGQNGASEEIASAEGDALAGEPLFGDADRTVQGQLGYLTDDPELSGIDHVTTVETADEQIGLDPRSGGRFSDEGTPELELTDGSTADCISDLGVDLGKPVALARPDQSAEVNAHSVIAFSSGVIATAGVSGAQGGTCLQLPAGHVPTDVALTDGNEIALVTTWQAETQTGSLVVIAFGDKSGTYQSSWSETYPGLPNPGHFATAEVVGTVELPFTAPTSVDAWSNSGGSLSLERSTVEDGAHADTVASAGHAIVGSLAEKQVVSIDLASTLSGLAAQSYGGAEFAFAATAGEPVTLDNAVADVAASESALAVATTDGVVHELDTALAETSATEVGANPTCLVYGTQSGAFIATSRGEAKVSWVSGGEVSKELTDSRLVDPLCASETPSLEVKNYAGSASVVLVSDFDGHQLHAYLDGEATVPSGATVGGDGFGYVGAYEVQGKPWGSSVTVDFTS